MEYVKNVVCPFCGTLCDDIVCKVENGKIVGTINACRIAHNKFVHTEGATRYTRPLIKKNGELVEVTYDEAIEKAAEILAEAKRPLLYGWSSTECEAHAVGMELAEETGAVIDNTASVCHGPSVLALQDVGYPTCTLGEVKNRADVVVYWGCNPMHAHPRHISRHVFSRGFFRERGKPDRTVIVVDPRETDTAKIADIHLQVEFDRDYELIDAMRAYLLGHEILYDEVAGIPRETIEEAVEIMKNAQFGILFWGMGLTHSRGKHRNIDTAIMLTEDLNDFGKFNLIPMRGHYNVTGFNQVASWESGFPYCVDFSAGKPRYNPGETGANDLLLNREADALMVVASDPGAHFPQKAVEYMAEIPVIAVEPHRTPTTELADIIIPPAIVGLEAEGTAYRMEGVPIRMRKVVETDLLPDKEIVEKILEKVREVKASK
ncbi:MAG TPA: formylmethanofuran dehydrogenase subunit B [Methanobacteriales archaeon]|nr:MAG: Tungsten formylmethanofuran dehydrogenase, subunit B [Methanobacteriaceae archaeon 41_258]MBC7089238.1 formylmethanofuran dehydrogenase subunit B [Methanobacteriaceae archaeon]MDI3484191.1 formylmethanofuran dehydrogenase subunit [Methanobacteriaceae archaeon]HIH61411.1 formylmethanofuran dehydrogenase subunit B [Methanobacteriales archaeon]